MLRVAKCEQNSPDWYAARMGIITCSELHKILVPKSVECFKVDTRYFDASYGLEFIEQNYGAVDRLKSGENKGQPKPFKVMSDNSELVLCKPYFTEGAETYMYELINERQTGELAPLIQTADMMRGHRLEPEARNLYQSLTGNEVSLCGFMTNHGIGYSPDFLVGHQGTAEVKTRKGPLQVKLLYLNEVPEEHTAQIQGGLWVSGREWCDFICHSHGLPLFVKRVYRDEAKIKYIAKRVAEFYQELMRRTAVMVKNGLKVAA